MYRRTSAKALLNAWQATVIKGNSGELAALANSTEVGRLALIQRLLMIPLLLLRCRRRASIAWAKASPIQLPLYATSPEKSVRPISVPLYCSRTREPNRSATGAIVVLTGVTDYVSDGTTVIRLSNGHPYLGEITGSGCMVGTAVATFCAGASLAEEAKRPSSSDSTEDAKLVRGDMLVAAVGG